MEFITGVTAKKDLEICDILRGEGIEREITIKGAIHTIRDMGDISFLVLRKQEGLVQCVYEGIEGFDIKSLKEGMTLCVQGQVQKEDRAPNGFEVRVTNIQVLSEPAKDSMMPIAISKWKLKTSLETKLSLRPIALRNIRERAIFKIQEGIVRGFSRFYV